MGGPTVGREVARFRATRANGREVEVVEVRETQSVSTMDGAEAADGLSSLFTEDGRAVNYKGGVEYEIVSTGEIVRRLPS